MCIVRGALWAQQGVCDRVPARLQGIIAAVPYPEGLGEIELLFILQIKTTQHHAFRKNKMWSDIFSLDLGDECV